MKLYSKRLYVTICFISSSYLFLSIFLSSIPFTTVSTKGNYKKYFNTLFPEGWAFFTIDPQRAKTYIYKNKAEDLRILCSSQENFFGISRLSRVKMIESEFLLNQIDSTSWVYCKNEIDFNKTINTIPFIKIFNSTNIQRLKGNLIIKKSSPVPFAWSKNKKVFMPCRVVKINVL